MFDENTSFENFSKYDQYDDNNILQIQTNLSEQSKTSLGNEGIQFQQLENSDHPIDISYECEEESVENLEISEGSLPLYFASFQFIKDNFNAIKNQQSLGIFIDNKEDNETLDQDSLVSQLQLSNSIEMPNQMTKESSIPLCFGAFQVLKEIFYNIFKAKDDKPIEIYEVPFEPTYNKLQQSFQVLYDPIDDRLDDESNHIFS